MLFSLIVPVFNRPDELHELLQSLAEQSISDFEVVVVDDGSTDRAEAVVDRFSGRLDIRYYFISNVGPGQARNYGGEHARGDYLIFFDSDCMVPPQYMETVQHHLETTWLDAYGGPDAAHPSFTPLQKAISYTMTSVLTTGGIRGAKRRVGEFHPRSFNMGISRAVYDKTGGFSAMRFGEDLDLSIRIQKQGFATGLIPEAFVYHKRRENLRRFFKQVYNSGIARINLYKRHPQTLRLTHAFPAAFTVGCVMLPLVGLLSPMLFAWLAGFFIGYSALIAVDAWRRMGSLTVAGLSVVAAYVQLIGYGCGFLQAVWRRLVRGEPEFAAFQRTFYD